MDFELEVSQSEEAKASTEAEAGVDVSAGWGPYSVKIHGKVSHKDEQTRKTDTRAKYSFHTSIKRSGPPEGMMRVIDFLTDAATKPVLAKPENKDKVKALPDTPPDPLAMPAKKGQAK